MRLQTRHRRVLQVPSLVMIGVVTVLVACPAAAPAFPNEPEGFEGARFGMSVEQVKKGFPKLELRKSTGKSMPREIVTYGLAQASVLGLQPCEALLEFVTDKFFKVTFVCTKVDGVDATLETTFGAPSSRAANGVFWLGQRGMVSLNPKSKQFAFMDRPLHESVQRELLMQLFSGGEEAAPSTPNAAATPVPKP